MTLLNVNIDCSSVTASSSTQHQINGTIHLPEQTQDGLVVLKSLSAYQNISSTGWSVASYAGYHNDVLSFFQNAPQSGYKTTSNTFTIPATSSIYAVGFFIGTGASISIATNSVDGSYLYINKELIINNPYNHTAASVSATYQTVLGRIYQIELYAGTNDATSVSCIVTAPNVFHMDQFISNTIFPVSNVVELSFFDQHFHQIGTPQRFMFQPQLTASFHHLFPDLHIGSLSTPLINFTITFKRQNLVPKRTAYLIANTTNSTGPILPFQELSFILDIENTY